MKKIITGTITLLLVGGSALIVGCATTPPEPVVTAPAPVQAVVVANPDDALVADVKAAFAADPELSSLPLKVKSAKGEVTISGNVKSGQQLYKAAVTAEKIKGVKYVINDMYVVE